MRLWAIGGLVAFLIADVALVGFALSANQPATESAAAVRPQGPADSADPAAKPSTSPTPSAEPAADADADADSVAAITPTRVLAALNEDVAWRVTSGACPDAVASPELTRDGGGSWESTNASRPTGVTAVQRGIVSSAQVASFIGLSDDDCTPQYVRTFVAGDNYGSYPEQLQGAWFLNPADPSYLHTPGADRTAPCDAAVQVAPRDGDNAALLCGDNAVHLTADGGETWTVAASVGSAVSVTASADGYLAAAVGEEDCAGVQLHSLTATGEASVSGCLLLGADPATLAGAVALAVGDGTLWVWAGDSFGRSSDGGATWL